MSAPLKKLVVVTGASGYLGGNVVLAALKAGYRVRGTVRNTQNGEFLKQLDYAGKADGDVELVSADILEPKGWDKVMEGATWVLHTASPFPLKEPDNENELIKPAVEGTLNVLKAAHEAKTIKRVVLTSSTSSVMSGHELGKDGKSVSFSEKDWSNTEKPIGAYNRSKTLAERAAWKFAEEHKGFELAVINPCLILGPPLSARGGGTSCNIVKDLLEGKNPGLALLWMGICDVRDVAQAHINALTAEGAQGQRHIICSKHFFYSDMARILSDRYNPQGWEVPTTVMPYALVYLYSFINPGAAIAVNTWGQKYAYETTRAKDVLGVDYTSHTDTLIDMAEAMIRLGMARKPKPGFFARLFGASTPEQAPSKGQKQ